MKWQDISTAPYDEIILIYWADGNIGRSFWYDEDRQSWIHSLTRRHFKEKIPATHWMPLPAPPKGSAS